MWFARDGLARLPRKLACWEVGGRERKHFRGNSRSAALAFELVSVLLFLPKASKVQVDSPLSKLSDISEIIL